ncbi:N-6 DNA methylase [Streptomyces beijiangensis]|uniref:N-6 DNA methylase n=1 Tax=Streptomyces beijiangensis TaxID=163361 RepID=A0A939FF59_9ACTN|nr:N-6 DNA methylase [Streptomyces beijiangensis]MBO0516267.1 N-6 DNA methylase [Streptomyces beijiangensis]
MQLDLFADTTEPAPESPPAVQGLKPAPAQAPRPSVTGTRPETRKPYFRTSRSSPVAFGEAIADAWYSAHGSSRMDIPVGIVATLALWPHKTPGAQHARTLADFIASYPAEDLPSGFGEVVARHWLQRPDLIDTAAPIFRWTEEKHDKPTLRAIKAVTDTALKHGVLWYTGDSDPGGRADVDLMSWTITNLRHKSSRSGLGEYHTPPEVCDLMAAMLDVSAIPEGGRIGEPAGGTGGMFRAASQQMRDRGMDPHRYRWMLQELDAIAAAGAAVNMLVWDLGPGALVACGNTLSEGDMTNRAIEHQRAVFEHRDRLVAAGAIAAAVAEVGALIQRAKPTRTSA